MYEMRGTEDIRTIKKRALAVCIAALVLVSGLVVSAEEMPEADTVNKVKIPAMASSGDAAVEAVNAEDMTVVMKTLAEDQEMVYADNFIIKDAMKSIYKSSQKTREKRTL